MTWDEAQARLEEAVVGVTSDEYFVVVQPDDIRAALQRVEELERRLRFYDEEGDPDQGWCGEHPHRFAANAREGDEGTYDECQKCRAEAAEARVEELERENRPAGAGERGD